MTRRYSVFGQSFIAAMAANGTITPTINPAPRNRGDLPNFMAEPATPPATGIVLPWHVPADSRFHFTWFMLQGGVAGAQGFLWTGAPLSGGGIPADAMLPAFQASPKRTDLWSGFDIALPPGMTVNLWLAQYNTDPAMLNWAFGGHLEPVGATDWQDGMG